MIKCGISRLIYCILYWKWKAQWLYVQRGLSVSAVYLSGCVADGEVGLTREDGVTCRWPRGEKPKIQSSFLLNVYHFRYILHWKKSKLKFCKLGTICRNLTSFTFYFNTINACIFWQQQWCSHCLYHGRRDEGLETIWMNRNIGTALLRNTGIGLCTLMIVVL